MGLFGWGKKKNQESGGDFSHYDSPEKVQQGVKEGVLAPMYLMSPRFGGVEDVRNILYVPPAIAALKERQDDMMAEWLLSGKQIGQYSVTPAYKGNSHVPASITIKAGGDVHFEETLHIW